MAGTIIKRILMILRAKTTVENTVMPKTIARKAMTTVVKENGISLKNFKQYFKVHLMYEDTNNSRWVSRTYLHYTLDLIPPTEHSVDSTYKKYPKSDKLLNDPKKQHAEIKLLEALKSEIKKFESKYKFKGLNVKGDIQARSINEKKSKMNLNIVMNYSPCTKCANEIENFLRRMIKKDWESEISITFGTFDKFYPNNDINKNVEGLANLWNAGTKLQLVWDDDKLNKYIEKIGTKEAREAEMKARETVDRQYLQDVEQKARQIAALME